MVALSTKQDPSKEQLKPLRRVSFWLDTYREAHIRAQDKAKAQA